MISTVRVIHRLAVLLVALVALSASVTAGLMTPLAAFHSAIEPRRAIEAINAALPVRTGAVRAEARVEVVPVSGTASDWAVVPTVRPLAPTFVTFSRIDHSPAKYSSLVSSGTSVRGPPSSTA